MTEQRRRQTHNAENQATRDKLVKYDNGILARQGDVTRATEKIADLERQVVAAKSALEAANESLNQANIMRDCHTATIAVLEDHDVEEINKQIVNAQTINQNVANAATKGRLIGRATDAEQESEHLTVAIDKIDADKQAQLAAVKWPVAGLGFGDTGVSYNGLPFSQASGAEQTEVSFAMAAALNPQLKIAIIRDASLLDAEQMAVVCKLAEKYDMQAWLEVVASDAPTGIFIEDGTVVSGGTPPDAAPLDNPKRKKRATKEAPQEQALPADANCPFDADEAPSPAAELAAAEEAADARSDAEFNEFDAPGQQHIFQE